jgi:hypothetical protein
LLQTLPNQLALSRQRNLQQSTPSASQPIGQAPPITSHSNIQGSAEAKTSTAPDPQPRILVERPSEMLDEIQAIEQVFAELKSQVKLELIDHFSEMLLKQYGIKPKQ